MRFKRALLIAAAIVVALAVLVWWRHLEDPNPSLLQEPVVDAPAVADTAMSPASEQVSAVMPDPEAPALVLSGTVYRGDTDEVMPGYTVVADVMPGQGVDQPTPECVSDENGNYILRLALNVRYQVSAVIPEGENLHSSSYAAISKDPASYKNRMIRLYVSSGAIAGRVVDGTPRLSNAEFLSLERDPNSQVWQKDMKAPFPGVRVRLEGEGKTWETTTDAEGSFEFAAVADGVYTVAAVAPPRAAASGENTSEQSQKEIELKEGEHISDVELVLRMDGVVLEGSVLDENGSPIPGAHVTARPVYGPDVAPKREGKGILEAVTGEDGIYRFNNVLPSDLIRAGIYLSTGKAPTDKSFAYDIQAEAAGYVPAAVRVPVVPESIRSDAKRLVHILAKHDGESLPTSSPPTLKLPQSSGQKIYGIDIVLPSPTSLAGTLIDFQNQPVPGGEIILKAVGAAEQPLMERMPVQTEYRATSDSQGGYAFDSLYPGEYTIQVDSENGTQAVRNGSVTIRAGDRIADHDIVVDSQIHTGTIEGLVLDANTNEPIKPHLVVIRVDRHISVRAPAHHKPMGGHWNNSGGGWPFVLREITAGTVVLKIGAFGYVDESREVEVHAGQTTRLDISLTPEAVMFVRATRFGQPVKMSRLDATYAETGQAIRELTALTMPGEQEGMHIAGLPAGAYDVLVAADMEDNAGGAKFKLQTRQTVHLDSGQNANVHAEFDGEAGLIVNAAEVSYSFDVFLLDPSEEAPLSSGRVTAEDPNVRFFARGTPGAFLQFDTIPAGRYHAVLQPDEAAMAAGAEVVSETVILRDGGLTEVACAPRHP